MSLTSDLLITIRDKIRTAFGSDIACKPIPDLLTKEGVMYSITDNDLVVTVPLNDGYRMRVIIDKEITDSKSITKVIEDMSLITKSDLKTLRLLTTDKYRIISFSPNEDSFEMKVDYFNGNKFECKLTYPKSSNEK